MSNIRREQKKIFCLLVANFSHNLNTELSPVFTPHTTAMNFQPSDYLHDLNLEFELPSLDEQTNSGLIPDLDIFSHTDFFDLDVFANDHMAPSKQQQQQQYQLQQPQHQLRKLPLADIKEEDPEGVAQTPAEEGSHGGLSIEELKRKKNTAALARFRVKKKMKEKQMEERARELQDKLSLLEKKVKTLEMENKCLKQLILEKNEKRNLDLLELIKKRSLETPTYSFT